MPSSYMALYQSGELGRRATEAFKLLSPCRLCPRECGVDRLKGEQGLCRTGRFARVASVQPHFGEENVLVGMRGSGTVFFSGCNLNCDFCQNWEISQGSDGLEMNARELAGRFLSVQKLGCHNLNLVTPTHVVPQILKALDLAAGMGLSIPLVYNCGGYEAIPTLKLLEGIVDIFMPDMKFLDPDPANRFCDAIDYPDRVVAAVIEMHRQVGELQIDSAGVATTGLLVRHLVLPHGLAGSEKVASTLAKLSTNTFVNVMAQYRPCHGSNRHPELSRRITQEEYMTALESMKAAGLSRLDGIWPHHIRVL